MNSLFENGFFADIINSKLNISLLCVCCYLVYKIIKPKFQKQPEIKPKLEPLKIHDFTLSELKKYNDTEDTQNRILVAVKGKVFDVSNGRRFYGKEGPYGVFAGRDASRALATFSLDDESMDSMEYDDLGDLTDQQMEGILEWQQQFMEKYHYVGNLVKPDQPATDYSKLNQHGDPIKPSANDGDAKKKD